MTNRLKYAAALLALMLAAAGCSMDKTIPDDTLRDIFKEIYITNAYVNQTTGVKRDIDRDSLDIYRPILAQYGYTVRDLESTFASFSKRKSIRLSDVIDKAIGDLEKEEGAMRYRIASRDSIDVRSKEMFRRVIFEDTLFTARKIADTAHLVRTIPVRSGDYEIEYIYELDSLEQNRRLRNVFTMIDTGGNKTATGSNWMTLGRRMNQSVKLTATDTDTALVMRFGNYPEKDMKRPYLTIDSIKIWYMMPAQEARDSAALRIFRYNPELRPHEIPVDTLEAAADSSALHTHAAGLPPAGSDNP